MRNILGKVSRKITGEQLSTGRYQRELKTEKWQLCGKSYIFGCITVELTVKIRN